MISEMDEVIVQINSENESLILGEKLLIAIKDEYIKIYENDLNLFTNKNFVDKIKKPENLRKLGIILLGAIGNAILLNSNLEITYILASLTCLGPAIYDFKDNYDLLKNSRLLKYQETSNLLQKIKKLSFS